MCKIYDFSALTFTLFGSVIAGDRCKRSIFLRNIFNDCGTWILAAKNLIQIEAEWLARKSFYRENPPDSKSKPKHKTLNAAFFLPKKCLVIVTFYSHSAWICVLRFYFSQKSFSVSADGPESEQHFAYVRRQMLFTRKERHAITLQLWKLVFSGVLNNTN